MKYRKSNLMNRDVSFSQGLDRGKFMYFYCEPAGGEVKRISGKDKYMLSYKRVCLDLILDIYDINDHDYNILQNRDVSYRKRNLDDNILRHLDYKPKKITLG